MNGTSASKVGFEKEPPSKLVLGPGHLWVVAIIAVGCVLLFAFFDRLNPNIELSAQTFLIFYVPLEVLRIGTCAGIFLVRWITRKFALDIQSLIIGSAFLALAVLFLFRLVIVFGLAGTANPQFSAAPVIIRIIAWWTLYLSMLVASFLPEGRKVSAATMNVSVTASGLAATATGIFVLLHWKDSFWINHHNAGAVEGWDFLGYAAMGTAFFLLHRYGHLAIKKRDPSLPVLALAMAVSIPAQFAYVLVNSLHDPLKLIGSFLGACSFILIFIALVRASLTRPYEQLAETKNALQSALDRLNHKTVELTLYVGELEAFSYSVAHDLRNPLQSIIGCSEILQKDVSPTLAKDDQKAIEHIVESADRMAQVITDLLTLSKITRQEIHRENVSLSDFAQSSIEELKKNDLQRKVEASIEPGLTAKADPGLARILIENLIRNAWKFTAKQPAARIEFGADRKNGSITYFVRDNGVGFDMAGAGNLFKAFVRLHSGKDFQGTGIGLATVKRIVDKHGGAVWAESEKGKGATFYFRLG